MRRVVHVVAALAVLMLLIGPSTLTVVAAPAASDEGLLADLRRSSKGTLRLARHAETGKLRLAATDGAHAIAVADANASPEQAARAFLRRYGELFGVRDAAQELSLLRQSPTDTAGRTFVRFQQRSQGVPILGGELIVQVNQRRGVVSASGELLPDARERPTPQLDASAARQQALASVAREYGVDASTFTASTPELWYYNPALLGGPGLRQTTLTWRLEVDNFALPAPVRQLVLVDARNGLVKLSFNQIAEAKNRFVCDSNNVADTNDDPNDNCDQASEYKRTEGQPASSVTDINLAYDYSGDTYDYYFTKFGRDSIDGAGLPLISLVRYCEKGSIQGQNCPYQNAFWNGRQMTYGDGYASADDVVAHELTHGVTESESHLFYYYQAGAINEALSDIFGEAVDQSNGHGTDTADVRWQLGEDLPASIGVIRNMRDPTLFGHPDRTSSDLFKTYSGDNGGVHSNSGVANKADFLMVDGGSFNGYSITGLGLDKAMQIWYRVNTSLLTSGSDYEDLGDALGASCESLTGSFGITAADCGEVAKVVRATEMDTAPANAYIPEAPVCQAGQTVTNAFFDNLENTASGNWASGAVTGSVNDWNYPVPVVPSAATFFNDGIYSTSGVQNLWGIDNAATGNYAIRMTKPVAVPANAFMHFRHAFEFDSGAAAFDGGVVEYTTNGTTWNDAGALFLDNGYNVTIAAGGGSTNPLKNRQAFGDRSLGYISSRLDLSSLAGQNVRFRFRIGTDAADGALGWFIDDVRIYTCGGAAVNTAPELFANGVVFSPQQSPSTREIGFATDDIDAAGSLKVAVSGAPAGMSISVANNDGTLVATLAPNCDAAPGTYQLAVTVTDSGGLTDTSTFTVIVGSYEQRVFDGGFEAGSPNYAWNEFSTNFGTPLCDLSCSGPTAAPHTGNWWAYFGGTASEETGIVSQTVDLPTGNSTLSFFLWYPRHSGHGASDYFHVLIDDTQVFSITDAVTTYNSAYKQVNIDTSAFAGGRHTLTFEQYNRADSGAAQVRIHLDDVSLAVPTNVCTFAPAVAFQNPAATTQENAGSALLTVSLDAPATRTATVSYAAAGGSATPGSDYTLPPGTLTFAPGERSKTITVALLNDTVAEGDETVVVQLSSPDKATLGGQSSITLTIKDDDANAPPTTQRVLLPLVVR